jgi:hypothetical protein
VAVGQSASAAAFRWWYLRIVAFERAELALEDEGVEEFLEHGVMRFADFARGYLLSASGSRYIVSRSH